MPFNSGDSQFVRSEIESAKRLTVVHADEVNTQHEHVVTTVVTVTETSPHGYIHDFVSTLVPNLFSTDANTIKGQAPNEIWVWAREYRPPTLTVPAGTTVTWVNKDPEEHTVTSNDGLFSGTMASLISYNFTFTQPGTYNYYCEPHPAMMGTITVK